MNAELRALLLDGLRVDEPDRHLNSDQIVLFRNNAPLPRARYKEGDFAANRGFDLLLLDNHGRTTHFVQCRPAEDESFLRTCGICERLTADSRLRNIVPPTRHRRSATVRVQLSRYVPGRSFQVEGPQMSLSAWVKSLRAVLHTAERLAQRAGELLPDPWLSEQPQTLNGVVKFSALRHMAALGLDLDRIATLERILQASLALPRLLQHGDFWPGNVLRHHHGWWILDYEMFASVYTPLYDVFHFIRCAALQRHSNDADPKGQTWLDRLARADVESAACQAFVRDAATRSGLTPAQVVAAYAYYIVDLTFKTHRRGVARDVWDPYLREVLRLADGLRRDEALPDLLLNRSSLCA